MGYSQEQMIGLGVSFIILPVIAVGFRVWAKSLGRKGLAWDDYFIFMALLFSIACCILQLVAAIYGQLGQHQTDAPDGQPILDDPRFILYEKCKFVGQIVATLGLGCNKASILIFYKNIFTIPPFRIAANVMLAVVFGWTVSYFFTNLFICFPITYLIEPFYHKVCIDAVPMWLSSCWSDVFIDVLILIMPIPMVLRLQLPLKQKIAVLGMFFLGAIVIALSITRLSFYIHVASVFAAHYADETYYTSPVFFWINIELALGVVASCLPTLRPIWLQLKPPSPTSKGSMQLSSYSGFSSRYSKKHHRMSDTQDDHDNINLTSTSTVDTHIQAGPQHPPRQLDEHVINVEQQMSTESRRLGNAV